jgi:hypothetical protein
MTTKYLSGGALAALAAALAFTAVPASAQNWHNDDSNDHDRGAQHEDRGNRHSGDRQSSDRHDQRAAPAQHNWNNGAQQRTQTDAATQARGQWTDRHVERNAQQAPRQTQAFRGWGDGARATTAQRNRTYVDPNRNQTYVDRNRAARYGDQVQNDRRDNDRWRNDRRDNDRWRNDRRDDSRQWNRSWRNDSRYDWQRYRTYNRNIYHLRPYYSPYRNYSYRRLSIGFYLDPLFFGQDYLIGDPGYYRLPDVYGPYRWVRYYDDALLVDVYTGEVVDVIYDFFW